MRGEWDECGEVRTVVHTAHFVQPMWWEAASHSPLRPFLVSPAQPGVLSCQSRPAPRHRVGVKTDTLAHRTLSAYNSLTSS